MRKKVVTPLCCSILRICVGTGLPSRGHSERGWFLAQSGMLCDLSDIKVDFNLIRIGVLAVVLRWGFRVTFVAFSPAEHNEG